MPQEFLILLGPIWSAVMFGLRNMVGLEGALALARALSSGALPMLRRLHLGCQLTGEVSPKALVSSSAAESLWGVR
jgi:hypothetical protein